MLSKITVADAIEVSISDYFLMSALRIVLKNFSTILVDYKL